MGWNTSALFVRDRTVEEVIGFLPDVFFFEPNGETVSAEEAWAGLPGPSGEPGEESAADDPEEEGSRRPTRSSTGALRVRRPSRSRLYLARTGRWCQLWDPDGRFAPRVELILEDGARELRGTQALAVRFDGSKGIYTFWLWDDAKLTRHASFAAGTCAEESGAALPIEGEVGPRDERFLWSVIGAVTGLEQAPAERFAIWTIS